MSAARVMLPEGPQTMAVLRAMEGRKTRLADGRISFVPSGHNVALIAMAFPGAEIEHAGGAVLCHNPPANPPRIAPHAVCGTEGHPSTPVSANAVLDPATPEIDWCGYTPLVPLKAHQVRVMNRFGDAAACAIFHAPGTGKTATALAKAGRHHARGEIDALLVVTLNGVHRQWQEREVPKHLAVPHVVLAYDKKPLPEDFLTPRPPLRVLCMSFDALISRNGAAEAARFAKAYAGRLMMVVDESHSIKNHAALRSVACCKLGKLARFRVAMTGTPLAKALEDEWSQFRFLDENVLGTRYLSTFRAKYCIMGGYENRSVVGHRNLDDYHAKVAPYVDRLRKEDVIDLPKVYDSFAFDLSPEQRRHYDALRRNLLTKLDDGTIATAQNAAVLITRLQQISSGLLVGEDGARVRLDNARIKALHTLLEMHESTEKVLIWARFTHEIEDIMTALDPKGTGIASALYGATSAEERQRSVDRFLNDPSCRFLVSNPAAGGTGYNLQGLCTTVIFYSNGYNAVHRWQAEDRVHRIGTTGTVTYYDVVARKTGDTKILANLRSKKNLADAASGWGGERETELDLLREIVNE